MQSPNRLTGGSDAIGVKLASIYPPTSPTSSFGIVSQPETPLHNDTVEEIMSANGHLIVRDYGPTSAVFTAPVLLTALITYTDVVANDATLVQLRLNVGGKYIPTSVRPGPKSSLELHAVLSTDLLARSERKVLLSVHAYRNDRIFDSCDFGFLTELAGQGNATIVGREWVTQPSSSHGTCHYVTFHAYSSSSQASVLRLRQFRRGLCYQQSIKAPKEHTQVPCQRWKVKTASYAASDQRRSQKCD
jgi:hypothetical protein